MKNHNNNSAREQLTHTRSAVQTGGVLMRGIQTHEDRRRPSAKRLRRWHIQMNRGFND